MRELFVYYRLAAADIARCEALVRGFQDRLMREVPGLQARLLARPAEGDAERTWMETYAFDTRVATAPSGGIDDGLARRIEASATVLAPHLRSPRRIEVFVSRW